VLLHRFHQENQDIQALRSREEECVLWQRCEFFYEDSMLQAKSKTEAKAQGKASNCSAILKERSLSFQMTPTR